MAEFLALSAALAWQEIRAGSECCEERLRENANAGLLQARTQEGSCYSLRLQESTVAYADLREFVRRLEKEGELKRIRTEVDPVLEITEVVQRASRADRQEYLSHRGVTRRCCSKSRRDRAIRC